MCNTLIVCAPRISREYSTQYNAAVDAMIDIISANYTVSKTQVYAASYEFTLLDQEPIDVRALEDKLCGYHLGVAGDDDTDLATLSRIAALRAFNSGRGPFTWQGWDCSVGEVMVYACVRHPLRLAPGELSMIERSTLRALDHWDDVLAYALRPFREVVVLLPSSGDEGALTRVKSVFRESYDIGVARADAPDIPGDVLLDQAMQHVEAS